MHAVMHVYSIFRFGALRNEYLIVLLKTVTNFTDFMIIANILSVLIKHFVRVSNYVVSNLVRIAKIGTIKTEKIWNRQNYYPSLIVTLRYVPPHLPMESGKEMRWLRSNLTRVRAVMLPKSSGRFSTQFSER